MKKGLKITYSVHIYLTRRKILNCASMVTLRISDMKIKEAFPLMLKKSKVKMKKILI